MKKNNFIVFNNSIFNTDKITGVLFEGVTITLLLDNNDYPVYSVVYENRAEAYKIFHDIMEQMESIKEVEIVEENL